jgi:hypothetical protein
VTPLGQQTFEQKLRRRWYELHANRGAVDNAASGGVVTTRA